ncbi:branched-chain amino acid transport system permease protein [Bradyrhizobium ottawaense]
MSMAIATCRAGIIPSVRGPRVARTLMIWFASGLVFLCVPAFIRSDFVPALLAQAAIAAVFALSYNMLFGQTGLLSFGHAVLMGLGGFATVHAMRAIGAHDLFVPLPAVPVAGAFGGLLAGMLFGWLATRRAGTAFAMITLGFAELVAATASVFPSIFGGEQGISVDRTSLPPFIGLDFGPPVQVYYLTVAWSFICILAIYALTRTPLGRLANATRDNAERVAFNGFDPTRIRFLMYTFSSLFAGIAGALYAINYEIVTSQSLGVHASGMVLVMTVVGGAGQFVGPAIGAVLITVLQVVIGFYTDAWLLYLGLIFMMTVLSAPEGICGLIAKHRGAFTRRRFARTFPAAVILVVGVLLVGTGSVVLVELSWRVAGLTDAKTLNMANLVLHPSQFRGWAFGAVLTLCGLLLIRHFRSVIASRFAAPAVSEKGAAR